MKFFILTAVLVSCAISSLGTAVVASDGSLNSRRSVGITECCHCNPDGSCDDDTPCTFYCGKGVCNIFGCNCDGGCRGSLGIIESKQQSLESKKSFLEASESSDFFDITDANNDGVITIDEWLDSPVRSTSSGETCSKLVKQWAKFDPAIVGYLTKHQAINRKA